MRSRVSGLTDKVLSPLKTRETVAPETPAAFAISLIVAKKHTPLFTDAMKIY
jgi:hypothetical protein